jgi:hypothetical protein
MVRSDAPSFFFSLLMRGAAGVLLFDSAPFGASPDDVYQHVKMSIAEASPTVKTVVCGGGRINHDKDAKKIHIYGYSVAFGKANHEVSMELLKGKYRKYGSITFSDDGY